MLERQLFQEQRSDEDSGQFLTPSYLIEILKRRAFYFAIPFVLIFAIGSLIALAWPAKYLSQGTILVESQEIPSDLVRPTVAALANDRIQIIQQRIMTRDNLLAIARKFQLSMGVEGRVSGTEIFDFIRQRTVIKPSELTLQGQRKDAIAFKVGFEYEQPQTAMKVANELVTMILNEDVRSRTGYATETTKFLADEVKRLENQLALNDSKILELKRARTGSLTDTSQLDDGKDLAALRGQLLLLSASYSDAHPDIQALKRKIKALEKSTAENPNASQNSSNSANTSAGGLDALQTQRLSLKEELNKASQKLSAARLGESLERGQHSERLEMIEQPTLPQKPTSPNRPKLIGLAFVLALMSGGGLVVAAEMLNQSVRRSSDLFSLVDSHLVVSIPYISTHREMQGKRKKTIITTGGLAMAAVLGVIILFILLPPMDILFEKAMSVISR